MSVDTGRDWLTHLVDTAPGDTWRELLAPFIPPQPRVRSLHLAVFAQPYLGLILDGTKTIESRFSVRKVPPYGHVESGDIVLLKATSGPIVGAFRASDVWYYQLDPGIWGQIRREYGAAICAPEAFWQSRAAARYATLIGVSEVQRLAPVSIPKHDRRSWAILAVHGQSWFL